MTTLQAFSRGWLAASRSKLALLLMWFTYALIAKIVALPALLLLLDPLAHSRMASKLLSHFDAGWLGDIIDSANSAAAALSGAAVLAAALTWLVAILFAGGAITMLDEHWERFSFSLFCSGAGEHFWRILRLSLLGLLFYGLAWLLGRVPSLLARKIYGTGMEEWPLVVAGIIGSVLTVLLLGWVATVLDYAKVRLVSGRTRGSFRALMGSFVFVFRHFSLTMGVWLMNALLFALLGIVYLKLSSTIQASATGTILLLIVVQQAFILFRTAQRVAAWGSALAVYRALALPVSAPFETELVTATVTGTSQVAEEEGPSEPPEWEGYAI